MATKIPHKKLTLLAAVLSVAFSASTTAGILAPGGSEAFNLEFKGAITSPGEAWEFGIPSETIQKAGNLSMNTSMAIEDQGYYVWQGVTDRLDLIYGYVDGAAAGTSGFNPEIQVNNETIEPGELRASILITAKDNDGNDIGSLEFKNVRHWASAVFALGRDFDTGVSVAVGFSDGDWLEAVNIMNSPGLVHFKNKLIQASEYMEARVKKSWIDADWNITGSSTVVEVGPDTFDYHGQRLITVDATDLKIDKSKNADYWRSDLSMIVTLK
ncbi:TPA: hypothetical protein RG830_004153 [Vibrio vulnificus]|nr:hypothetical protein [Vibrio vulnificus]HDU8768341.1 hypothetical protein [Vibrio vulnificus]